MSVFLLLVMAVTHLGTELVAKSFGLDRAWLFYIARGIEGVFLYGLLLRVSPYVAAVAVGGMIESAMTSVCGTMFGLRPINPKPFEGLCDAQVGYPIFHYISLIVITLLVLSISIRRRYV